MKVFREKVFKKEKENVYQYTLINNNNIEVKILTLGGIITDIITPDRYGRKENIVVKWDSLLDYLDDDAYTGSIVGRTAGRIADGTAVINGEKIKFNINNNNINQHHGGIEGFNKKVWKDSHLEEKREVSLILEYNSLDGEENYPGNLNVKVVYTLNNDNELIIDYYGNADKDTLLNMTNHTYFNLSGNLKNDILDEILTVKASKFAEIREDGALTGKIVNVQDTPFDFRESKAIGRDIFKENKQLKLGNGYDHPWILDSSNECIILEDDKSGRVLKVSTDYKSVIIYTTNYPSDKLLFTKYKLREQDAICLETQNLPIAANNKFIEDVILLKNKEYHHKTVFKFLNKM